MNLITLVISITIVIVICAVFWFLERIYDITAENIVDCFLGICCFIAGVGMIYITIELLS